MRDEILMVRLYLNEADHGRRRTLMQEILALLRERHAVQGVTVFRGIAGIGARGILHADDLLRVTVDLPLVIEFFDAPPVAEAAIALLADLVPGNHIVSWPAVRHGKPAP
jgi:PII-like signaling protein